MTLALFDIDGTLVVPPSCERRFYAYMWKRGRQSPRNWLPYLHTMADGFLGRSDVSFKNNKAYFAGMPVDEVEALGEEWLAEVLHSVFFPEVLARLEQHRSNGDDIWLLTGAPDFLAADLARHFNALGHTGTLLAVEDGRFTRSPPLRHPYGPTKRELAQEIVASLGIEAKDVVAYGNAEHDEHVLRWAGTAVAVHPDRGLRDIALAEGWEVLAD